MESFHTFLLGFYSAESPIKLLNKDVCQIILAQFRNYEMREADIVTPTQKIWLANGKKHRDFNLPAVVYNNGRREWWVHGVLQRRIFNGNELWAQNGVLHRIGGPAFVKKNEIEEWRINGKLHREDGPAFTRAAINWHTGSSNLLEGFDFNIDLVEREYPNNKDGLIYINSGEFWCLNGEYHRVGGPAVTRTNGTQEWWINGQLHREDGPAIVNSDGTQEWMQFHQRHREDGPAVVYSNGLELYYINGRLHREDGPAVVRPDGSYAWYRNGRLHRTNGPAVVRSDGSQEYWIDGVEIV